MLRFLKDWSKKNGVNNDVHIRIQRPPEGRQVARMHRYSLCMGDRGAPLLVNERITKHLHSEDFARVELTVHRGCIRLMATPRFCRSHRNQVTLLSYTCRASDIDVMRRGVATKLGLTSRALNSYVKAWLNCEPLSRAQFKNLLDRIVRERGTDLEPRPDWLGRTEGFVDWPKLEARVRELGEIQLRYSGILRMAHSPGKQTPQEQEDDEEFDLSFFDEFIRVK
ncbi:unnamed protein product [Ixodes pacificus]